METIVNIDTQAFARTYTTLSQKHRYKDDLRVALAEANNCVAIGRGSCYADMVAVPKDYPSVVIKICHGQDAFIGYAHACVSGKLKNKHHLKVYSEAEIGDGVWLFVMERLADHVTVEEADIVWRANNAVSWRERAPRGGASMKKALAELRSHLKDCCFDLHTGNLMKREDGTIVLLDPVC